MCKTEYVIEVESVMSNGTARWTENTEFSTNNHYSKTLNISSRAYYLIVKTILLWS